MEDRLVELTLKAVEGETDEIERLAQASGYPMRREDKVLYIKGQVNTAIPLGADPVTTFTCLCFAFLGPFWP